MSYISREAAIDALKDMYEAAEKWGYEAIDDEIKTRAESCMASLIEMKLRIEKLPSAQPEIIRCKDCKWKNEHNCTRAVEVFIKDNTFCSWAERKDS